MSKANSMAKLAGSWTSEFPDFSLFILTEPPSLIREQTICHFPSLNQQYNSLTLWAVPIAKDKQIKLFKVLSNPI